VVSHPGLIDRFNRGRSFLHQQIREWLSEPHGRQTTSGRRVLEIGCATADNLEPFIRAGWKASAVEPNRGLANIAKSKGVEVHIGLCDSFRWEKEKFDVILLNHVLEHDYDPRMILEKCVYSLKLGGALYVEIPVVGTPSWTMFGRYWGELEFPVHLSLLRKEHLIAVIEQLGCRPVAWKTRTLLGTTLRTLEKFPRFRVSNGSGRVVLMSFALALQGGLILLNSLLRQGEAFSVVARREFTSGIE
jgi:SAM-dependent methyltransferase